MLCQIEQDSNKQFMAVVLCQQSYMCFLIKPYFQYIGFWDNLGWLDQNFKYLKSEKRQNHLKRQRAHAVLSSYLWLNKWEKLEVISHASHEPMAWVVSILCITSNDLDNRRITFSKIITPVERLHYADWPTIVQCQFYPILFLCEPTSFGLIKSLNWPGKVYVFSLVALTLTVSTSYIPHQYSPSKGTRLSLQNIALPESDSKMVKQKFADPASWWRKILCKYQTQ